jgi:hypothetical protein
LEAFLKSSEVYELRHFLRGPSQDSSSQSHETNDKGDICVRIRLIPVPKPAKNQASCQNIISRYFQKIKNLCQHCTSPKNDLQV